MIARTPPQGRAPLFRGLTADTALGTTHWWRRQAGRGSSNLITAPIPPSGTTSRRRSRTHNNLQGGGELRRGRRGNRRRTDRRPGARRPRKSCHRVGRSDASSQYAKSPGPQYHSADLWVSSRISWRRCPLMRSARVRTCSAPSRGPGNKEALGAKVVGGLEGNLAPEGTAPCIT
jgi:hypothetical protein